MESAVDAIPINQVERSIGQGAKTKEKRSSQKFIWLMTYGAAAPYITPAMLRELGDIEADECHSTKDRAFIYTYIHLTKRIRQSAIEKFMSKAREMHGIVKNEIYGYDAIVANDGFKDGTDIRKHPAFQVLVKHYLTNNPEFKPWTDGEPILKRGLILRFIESNPERPLELERKSKAQVIVYAKKLEEKVKQAKKMERELNAVRTAYMSLSDERSSLRVENTILKRKIEELEGGGRNTQQGE
jgi:hypothetical protein